jgi:hypothetical protein
MDSDESEDAEEWQVAPVQPEALWPETGSSRVVVDVAAVSDRGLAQRAFVSCQIVKRINATAYGIRTYGSCRANTKKSSPR